MAKMFISTVRCKQCGLCVVNCPQEALSYADSFNDTGYRPVRVDDAKCVKCGLCYITCPDRVFEIVGAPKKSTAAA